MVLKDWVQTTLHDAYAPTVSTNTISFRLGGVSTKGYRVGTIMLCQSVRGMTFVFFLGGGFCVCTTMLSRTGNAPLNKTNEKPMSNFMIRNQRFTVFGWGR